MGKPILNKTTGKQPRRTNIEELTARLLVFLERHHHEISCFDIVNNLTGEDSCSVIYEDGFVQINKSCKARYACIKFTDKSEGSAFGISTSVHYNPLHTHVVTYDFDEQGYITGRTVNQRQPSMKEKAQQ